MEIDKKKVADGLKTAADIAYDVAKTGAYVAKEAAPVVGNIINQGIGVLGKLLGNGNSGAGGGEYTPSEGVTQLKNQADSLKAPVQKPSQYQDYLQQTMDAILNKKDFKFDVNGNSLFQQYKDQYTLGGQMAMQDTMGQASALTGGYGNSYAQTVGQQQYQSYLQQLNDRIPELYQLARDSYDRDTANLYNRYGLLADAEEKEYSRYRDEKADFYTDRDYYTNQYYNERDFEYGKHRDNVADRQWQETFDRGVYESDRDFAYQQQRDSVADRQWQDSFNRDVYESDRNYNRATYESDRDYQYKLGRDAIDDKRYDEQWQNTLERQKVSDSQWDKEFNLALSKASKSSSSGSNANSNNSGSNPTDNNAKPIDATEQAIEGLKTYEDTVKYLKDNGKSTAGIMTKNEWHRRKASYKSTGTGSTEVTQYNSYIDYLKAYCKYLMKSEG